MSGSVNRVILVGNLCADVEVRNMQNGKPVCNLRLATNESWKTKDGERKERAEFHTVIIFSEGLCRIAEQYLRKGSKIYIEGRIATRSWDDQKGNKRYSTEIILDGFNSTLTMLDSKGDNVGAYQEPSRDVNEDTRGGGAGVGDLNDEVPFAPEWRG